MRKRKKNRQNVVQRLAPVGSTLSDRAETVELLYRTLEHVAHEDIDGVKKALVQVDPQGITVRSSPDSVALAAFYGLEATSVADMQNPFPLLPQRNGPPEFDQKEKFDRSLLRQALRRIVDEV